VEQEIVSTDLESGELKVNAFSFELKVLQFALLSNPLTLALAVGKLNVCVEPVLEILKSDPLVPVANDCVELVNPFNVEIPPSTASFAGAHIVPFHLIT
jgi:hypothetical protein